MRTNTHLHISHTVYPDGLRIDYDYYEPKKTMGNFSVTMILILFNLSVWAVVLYLIFL